MCRRLANNTTKQKRSKAIDMRFHWLRDRVGQKHFDVLWREGKNNLADYFTKIHPISHVKNMRRFFVQDHDEAPVESSDWRSPSVGLRGCVDSGVNPPDSITSNHSYPSQANQVVKHRDHYLCRTLL